MYYFCGILGSVGFAVATTAAICGGHDPVADGVTLLGMLAVWSSFMLAIGYRVAQTPVATGHVWKGPRS